MDFGTENKFTDSSISLEHPANESEEIKDTIRDQYSPMISPVVPHEESTDEKQRRSSCERLGRSTNATHARSASRHFESTNYFSASYRTNDNVFVKRNSAGESENIHDVLRLYKCTCSTTPINKPKIPTQEQEVPPLIECLDMEN